MKNCLYQLIKKAEIKQNAAKHLKSWFYWGNEIKALKRELSLLKE